MASLFKRMIRKWFRRDETVIPVVRLHGPISPDGRPFRPALNLATVASALDKAFAIEDAPAVAILINSPGGSAVQSRMIYHRIRALAEEKGRKVLVFVEDIAASGGYMIALAGDEIIADSTSIVGSIGVVYGGFGFPELMRKIGVESRVYTAGENKMLLDPFKPEKESDIYHLKGVLHELHEVFIDMVKARRGRKLSCDAAIFSGLFWTGRRGLELGLVDGLGDMRQELRKRYGDKVRLELIGSARNFFGRRVPGVSLAATGSEQVAASAASALIATVEERLLWSRYGL